MGTPGLKNREIDANTASLGRGARRLDELAGVRYPTWSASMRCDVDGSRDAGTPATRAAVRRRLNRRSPPETETQSNARSNLGAAARAFAPAAARKTQGAREHERRSRDETKRTGAGAEWKEPESISSTLVKRLERGGTGMEQHPIESQQIESRWFA